jgi:hypothetical protein
MLSLDESIDLGAAQYVLELQLDVLGGVTRVTSPAQASLLGGIRWQMSLGSMAHLSAGSSSSIWAVVGA